MATTGKRYPAAVSSVAGTWTALSAALLGADDRSGTSGAAYNPCTRNTTFEYQAESFGLDALIPVGATIDSVVIEYQQAYSASTTSTTTIIPAVGGTNLTTQTQTATPTGDTTYTYDITSLRTPWTRADLLDGVFTVNHRVRRTATGTLNFFVDYICVTVGYTTHTTTPKTVSVTLSVTPQRSAHAVVARALAISTESAIMRRIRHLAALVISGAPTTTPVKSGTPVLPLLTPYFASAGGDETFGYEVFSSRTNNDTSTGSFIGYSTDWKHTGLGSFKFTSGAGPTNTMYLQVGTLPSFTYYRMSLWANLAQYPQDLAIPSVRQWRWYGNVGWVVNNAGYIVVEDDGQNPLGTGTHHIGLNEDHRISMALRWVSSTDYDIKLWVDGVLDVTVDSSHGAITTPSRPTLVRIGYNSASPGTNRTWYADSIYVDMEASLTDPGGGVDLLVTPKRPISDGTRNWTTQYTPNYSIVNERPLNSGGGHYIATTNADYVSFGVEAASAGDTDISSVQQRGLLGWGSYYCPSNDTTAKLRVLGTDYAINIPPGSNARFCAGVATSTYPTGTDVIGARGGDYAYSVQFHECGILVVYAPPSGPPVPNVPTSKAPTLHTTSSFRANWSAPTGGETPTGYRLDVSTDPNFGSFVTGYQDLDVGNVLLRSVSGLSEGGTFYYRVRAYNANGSGSSSAVQTSWTTLGASTGASTDSYDFETGLATLHGSTLGAAYVTSTSPISGSKSLSVPHNVADVDTGVHVLPKPSADYLRVTWKQRMENLGGTTDYLAFIKGASYSAAELYWNSGDNCVSIYYHDNTHNYGEWRGETPYTVGTAYTYSIEYIPASGQVKFWINDVLQATITGVCTDAAVSIIDLGIYSTSSTTAAATLDDITVVYALDDGDLAHDQFTTAVASPLPSPHTMEPGPGSWTVVGPPAGGSISTSGGNLLLTSIPTRGNNGTDYGLWTGPYTRTPGMALYWKMAITGNQAGGGYMHMGQRASTGLDTAEGQWQLGGASWLKIWSSIDIDAGLAQGTVYEFAEVLTGSGELLFIKGGVYTEWTLLWVNYYASNDPIYPYIMDDTVAISLDEFRVYADKGGLWKLDFGIATSFLPIVPSDYSYTMASADELGALIWTPAAGETLKWEFRRSDADNLWRLELKQGASSTGSISVVKRQAGVESIPNGAYSASINAGQAYRVVVSPDGSRIFAGVHDGIQRHTGQTFNQSAVGARIFGTSGAINLERWPRLFTGTGVDGLAKP